MASSKIFICLHQAQPERTVRRALQAALMIGATLVCASSVTAGQPQAAPPQATMPQARAGTAAIAAMERSFADLVAREQRAGIVWRIMRDGKIISSGAIGWQDREQRMPMSAATTFRLYSMSRAITSVAGLRLVERGRLSLDEPLAKYLPAFADPRVLADAKSAAAGTVAAVRPILIRDLFTYTAGFGYAPDYPSDLGLRRDDVIGIGTNIAAGADRLAKFPLLFQPGARWHYGFSSDVLGRVIEVVTGKPLDRALRELVLDPLDMKDTGFRSDEQRLARAYGLRDGRLVELTDTLPKSADYLREGSMHSGGGGLVATADDYLKFCEMLRQRGLGPRGRLLQERTVQAMLTNELRSDQGPLFWHQKQPSPLMRGGGWGLGIGVRTADVDEDPLVSHRGEAFWGGLAGTGFLVDPASGTSAVVMSQYYGREGDDVSFILRRGVYGSP